MITVGYVTLDAALLIARAVHGPHWVSSALSLIVVNGTYSLIIVGNGIVYVTFNGDLRKLFREFLCRA